MSDNRNEITPRAAIQKGYMSSYGNDLETEALPGALPARHNSTQNCDDGLNTEQLSAPPFKAENTPPPLPRASQWALGSGSFLAPQQANEAIDTAHRTDFEAEIAIIIDDVPMNAKPDTALRTIWRPNKHLDMRSASAEYFWNH